jgi:hypothetical protein
MRGNLLQRVGVLPDIGNDVTTLVIAKSATHYPSAFAEREFFQRSPTRVTNNEVFRALTRGTFIHARIL